MFHLELSRHGMILMTPLFAVTVSFMRVAQNMDALESGVILRYGPLHSEPKYGWYDYPHRVGFMWFIPRLVLRLAKQALHFEVYP